MTVHVDARESYQRPLTVPLAADGSFEFYGLREGRSVGLVFNDGDLKGAVEFQIETIANSSPLLFFTFQRRRLAASAKG